MIANDNRPLASEREVNSEMTDAELGGIVCVVAVLNNVAAMQARTTMGQQTADTQA